MRGLFIFRRDLRTHDNSGLIAANQECEEVLPCFIFNPEQIINNPYKGLPSFQFLLESLRDLENQLKELNTNLLVQKGNTIPVLKTIIKKHNIQAIYVNRDYTPFSQKRDTSIKGLCEQLNITFNQYNDALLTEPEFIQKSDGTPYTVFTPFYNKAKLSSIPLPRKLSSNTFMNNTSNNNNIISDLLSKMNAIQFPGGRSKALELLKEVATLQEYNNTKDTPSIKNGTSSLSAHIKFGTISIREIHEKITQKLGKDHPLIRQLYWRDFFHHIAFHYPHVFGNAFKKRYTHIPWSKDKKLFQFWCEGKTGFPIVDAGMRELNETGLMHNRVRMIVASFLTKDLHIDWRWGEKYFAQKLIDYDPCVNNGNWQWAASTGCDAQPYFRVFSPWRQIERFDPECTYIKKWVPELVRYTPKEILSLEKGNLLEGYTTPIVDHKEEVTATKAMFATILNKS